ncbi:MAG: type 4a pilus biogenesis protein PilO [Phycisphaeraceae bacterium]|nr:type 4a pilus biogenesis protein PilO [Phycisphaeraceae bacterium]
MRLGFREMLFLVLLAALPVAFYFFAFEPRNRQIAQARQEIQRKQDRLAELEKSAMDLSDLGREIDKLSASVDLFERKLPAQREVEVVLKEVWEMATRHRLTPRSVHSDKPRNAAKYAELPLRMSIVGDFTGYYAFLLELEKMPRITQTPRMKLKKLEKEEGQMEAEMVLSIFFETRLPGEGVAGTGGEL